VLLISGLGEGWVCSKLRVVSPGSGRDLGVGVAFATSPSFAAAWQILVRTIIHIIRRVMVLRAAPA